MALKNYSSRVEARVSLAEIQEMLVDAGAANISVQYDMNRRPIGVAFTIATPAGALDFALPVRVEAALTLLKQQGVARKARYLVDEQKRTEEQRRVAIENRALAERVAWRIIRDWLDAQLALIQVGMASLHEIFFPYQLAEGQRTVFEVYQEHQAALPKPGAA
jgi:hypothetical protein